MTSKQSSVKTISGSHDSTWMPPETVSSTVQLHPSSDPERDAGWCRPCDLCLSLWLVWLIMTIIAVIMVLCVEFAFYPRQIYDVAPCDVRVVVSQPGFGIFCRAAEFSPLNKPFQVTSLPEYPSLNKEDFTHHEVKSSQQLSPNGGYVYRAFYLLEGSVVKVHPCGQDPAGYLQYVMKGQNNLQQMRSQGNGEYIDRDNITSCDKTFTYTINQTDDYYFYYTADWNATVELEFQLDRTDYDYSKSEGTFQCPRGKVCAVPVSFTAHEILVYRGNSTGDFETSKYVDCELGLPLFLGVMILGFIVSVIVVLIGNSMNKRPKSMLNVEPIYLKEGNHM